MKSWSELYGSTATYESQVIDISSKFDYYIVDIICNYTVNDGTVDVEIRTSDDNGFTWSDWVNVNKSYTHLFDGDGIRFNYKKMQFRVIMNVGKLASSPAFKSIDIKLYGAYKIVNTGDIEVFPELWISKINSSGDIHINNKTSGKTLSFSSINNTETIYVDCENKDIMTDLPLTYRYNNHNKVFLRLEVGENIITGTGNYLLTMRNEYKILQG